MPILIFLIILLLLTAIYGVHLLAYRGIAAILGLTTGPALLFLKIAVLSLGIGFILTTVLAMFYDNGIIRLIYRICASWYGFLVYILLAVVIFSVLSALHVPTQSGDLAGKILLSIAFMVGVYGIWNANVIRISRYSISLPNLPQSWVGKKIVWVSDVHLGDVHAASFSARIVDTIENEAPDAVFIGGDLYDGSKINESAVIAPFARLRPKDGIYFITGNHEEFRDKAHFVESIKNAGITVLDNQSTDMAGVQIIGVDDKDSSNRARLDEILSGLNIDRSKPSILLKHQPSFLDLAESRGISMQISGHTHKAQLWPLSYIPELVYKGYSYGSKKFGSMQVVVSSGVGTWGPPMRVGSKSEIVVISFE